MSRSIARRPGLARRVIAGAVAAALLAGCGSDGLRTGTPTRPSPSSLGTPASTTTPPTTAPATAPPTTAPTDEPGWVPATEVADHIVTDTRTITTPAGAHINLVRARAGTYRLDLHVGSVDPPTGGTSLTADEGDAISVAERPQVVAAFNGGFKAAAGAGGIEVGGHILTPLVAGDASLVIDRDGTARIGTWDQTVPIPGEQVDAVRQDLHPLIAGGVTSPSIGSVSAWGTTLGGGSRVARSAVGTDAAGDLVYAASMSAVPSDLALALTTVGVTQAMELDINPEWVQAVTATPPGGPLATAVTGQDRPADQYQQGWSRDFFVVLAR